jgi:lactonase
VRWSKLTVCVLLAAMPLLTLAQSNGGTLAYAAYSRATVPIPLGEQGLQTVTAEPWLKVSDKRLQLEGPAFDRDGNLFLVDVFNGQVLKVDKQQKISRIYEQKGLNPAGLAIHRDGRLFIAGLGDFVDKGQIIAIKPDGSGEQVIVPTSRGLLPDDLEFDADGGFYFTDFRGTSTDLAGGVYYVPPTLDQVTPVLPHMAVANGVTLSPDGKTLWVTEFSLNRLHKVSLKAPAKIAPFGTSVPYHFVGGTPDSARTDADGNVYVAMYSQGRVLAFNPNGFPIGQILLPARERGHNLLSTSMVFRPGTNDLYIVANDGEGGSEGSQIFHAKGFAKGKVEFSHR